MTMRIRFVVSTLLAACGLAGPAALEARAQIDLQEAFTGVPMARRQWEQRMTGQVGPAAAPAAHAGVVPGGPAARPAPAAHTRAVASRPSAGGVQQASTFEEYELAPADAARAAEDVYFEPLPNGGVHDGPLQHGGFAHGPDGCADCQAGWGGCDVTYQHHGACGTCGPGIYDDCGAYPMGPLWWVGHPRFRGLLRDLSLFAGVHGFKGPLDQGRNGNFGFHEGFNFGSPLGGPWGLGYQVGAAAVHSNFTGADASDPGQDRNQVFITAGIFRPRCVGLNWGVVFDYLNDNYYIDADLRQIRSETSWRFPNGSEVGYWGAYGVSKDRSLELQLQPTDLFAFYYRRHFQGGGDGRIWGGFSGHGDGVFGADIRVPIGHGWALENSINYLAPKSANGNGQRHERESWGVNIQLVWYLGQPAACALKSPYRPLFGVANNATFMADFTRTPTGN